MEKLLTVSVDAYNGTATLQKALESCLVADESLQALLDVIIIDDMISSGDSIIEVATELKRRKAKRIFAAATFGLFTNGLAKFDAAYEQGIIDHILTTNLVYQRPELLSRPYYVNVDLSKYIALLIDNLNHNVSIHGLLNPTDRINRILEKHRAAQAQKAAKNNISEEA